MTETTQSDWSRKLLWPTVALMLIAKVWLTFTRYLNQDEFETLHQGWLIFSGAVQFRDFNSNHPPIAFWMMGFLNYLTTDPVVLVYLGRGVTLLAALTCLFLICRISQAIFDDRAARWTTIVYCVNVTFLEWAIEIRSDIAMLPLWLAGVYLFVSQPRKISAHRALWVGVFLGLAFWANQKVVFHVVPLSLFMLMGGVHKTWRLSHTAIALLGSIFCCVCFLAHAAYIGSLPHMFQHNFGGAWSLVLSGDYAAWRNETIRYALLRDPMFVVLGLIASLWGINTCRTRLATFAGASTLWMVVTLFLTPGPFPYYLTSVFPFFAISIGGWLANRESEWTASKATRKQHRLLWLGVAVYLAFPAVRYIKLLQPTIGYQLQVLNLANQITDPNTTVFDGAGAQLNRPDAYPFHWVLWQGERQRYLAAAKATAASPKNPSAPQPMPRLFPLILENQCELIIDNYRLAELPVEDRRRIVQHFVTWWGPLRIPGFDSIEVVGQSPRRFELMFDGEYTSSSPTLLIDGQPWRSGEKLSRGSHTIAVMQGEPARVTLRRITKAEPLRPTTDHIDPSRFLGFYGYSY